jgi:dolichol-phosphate mannosyltransferase
MHKKISIIIPCLNEERNIEKIHIAIKKKFKEKSYEIIFVDDDSIDGTQKEILKLNKKENNVKYIFRKKDKDLSRAFIAGVNISKSKYIILMDCDLQHDPQILNNLSFSAKNKNVQCVSGSRFMRKSVNNTKKIKYVFRLMLSRILNYVINFFLNMNLTDPLTGIFIVERKVLLKNKKNLYLNGYKIFLDFYTTNMNREHHCEIPIKLNERIYGESKLTSKTLLNIIKLIFFKKFN